MQIMRVRSLHSFAYIPNAVQCIQAIGQEHGAASSEYATSSQTS
jgi:hypothetical protein